MGVGVSVRVRVRVMVRVTVGPLAGQVPRQRVELDEEVRDVALVRV